MRVRVPERVHHVAQDAHGLGDGQLTFPHELGAERFALDVRHCVIQQVARGTCGEQRHDVRVLERGRELDFAAEPLGVDARGEIGGQHLDHYSAAERRLDRQKNAAHATPAQLALDPVGVTEGGLQSGDQLGQTDARGLGTIPS